MFKMGKGKPNPEIDPDDEDVLVKKVENLEELVNKRTKGLQEVTDQINHLAEDDKGEEQEKAEEKEDEAEALLTPASTPEQKKPGDEESPVDLGEILAEEKEGQAEEGAEGQAKQEGPAPAAEGKKEGAKKSDDDDSMENLFSEEDDEEDPLTGLIQSLPDVSASELLNEAQEVSIIVREWKHQ